MSLMARPGQLRHVFVGGLLLVTGGVLGAYFGPSVSRLVIDKLGLSAQTQEDTRPASGPPDEVIGKLRIYVLIGQSNMSGKAEVSGQPRADSSVFVFGNDYRWRGAFEPLDDATGQVDPVSKDRRAGTSPGLAFGQELARLNPESTIGLIPCARSGSSIRRWKRDLSEDSLYGSCLKRCRAASVYGQIAGVIMFQGESDGLDPEFGAAYEPQGARWSDEFRRLVENLRVDLRQPELPVVFAVVGEHPGGDRFTQWDQVIEAQSQFAMPGVASIRTADLPRKSDRLHLTAESSREAGRRFARAMQQLHESVRQTAGEGF